MAKRSVSTLRKSGSKRACSGWGRVIHTAERQAVLAERQEQRERDRQRFGCSYGFLHEVPDQAVTDRQVAAEIARWQREKAG